MIELHNCDNLEIMATMPNESIDVICIDPPYLYLKGQKLEREFDEELFFSECKRLLTKNGFVVMFGRGTSFYRWNTILDDLGFTFKEEIIWDKSYTSSPLMCVGRVHETISIFCKGKSGINRSKIPYLEMKSTTVDIIPDLKRLRSVLNNSKSLIAVLDYVENKNLNRQVEKRFSIAASGGTSIDRDRAASVIAAMDTGFNEKTIIKSVRDHYSGIHPTQKPVRLIERLLALVIPKNKPIEEVVVADFFGGSFSTMEAVHNIGCRGIATEIVEEYFNAGKARIEKLPVKQKELFDKTG